MAAGAAVAAVGRARRAQAVLPVRFAGQARPELRAAPVPRSKRAARPAPVLRVLVRRRLRLAVVAAAAAAAPRDRACRRK